MSGWVPGLPGAPPTLLHTALPGGLAAFLAAEQQRLASSGAGRPSGYGAPDPTGGRHLVGGYGSAPDGQVHHKVALLLHWLLAGGHITPDVAVRPWGQHPGMGPTQPRARNVRLKPCQPF